MLQVGHQHEVLGAGKQVVDGGELTGDPDERSNLVGLAGQVKPADTDLAPVGAEQGREDPHGSGLSGTVGTEQRKHAALADLKVDVIEDDPVTEGLAQAGGTQGRAHTGGCHAAPCRLLMWARRTVTSPNPLRARTSTVGSEGPGRSLTSSTLWTRPKPV